MLANGGLTYQYTVGCEKEVPNSMKEKILYFFQHYPSRCIKFYSMKNGSVHDCLLVSNIGISFVGEFYKETAGMYLEEIGRDLNGILWTIDVLTNAGELIRYRPQRNWYFEKIDEIPKSIMDHCVGAKKVEETE